MTWESYIVQPSLYGHIVAYRDGVIGADWIKHASRLDEGYHWAIKLVVI